MMKFFRKVPLLKRLPADQLPILASKSGRRKYADGIGIVHEGKVSDGFFVIVNGGAKVLQRGKLVATLVSGDYFGEKALLHDEVHLVTVTAKADMECLEIHRDAKT